MFVPASVAVRPITATLVRQIAQMGGDVPRRTFRYAAPPGGQVRHCTPFVPAKPTLSTPSFQVIRILTIVAALLCIAPAIAQPLPANLDKANAIVIDTTKAASSSSCGPTLLPATRRERTGQLAREGYYNNVPFHRVMDGFMAQTGDARTSTVLAARNTRT